MDNNEQDHGMFGGLMNKAKEMLGGSGDTAKQGQDMFGQRSHEGEGIGAQDEADGYGPEGSIRGETTPRDQSVDSLGSDASVSESESSGSRAGEGY